MNHSRRVAELQHLTPKQLDRLKRLCHRHIFNPTLADEALAHALAVAFEKFDGRVPLPYYIIRVARNYAATESRSHQTIVFSDYTHPDEHPSAIDNIPDPRLEIKLESEIEWAERVALVLKDEAQDLSLSKGRRIKAKRAHTIFLYCLQAAQDDEGVGVDEYQATSPEEAATIHQTYTSGTGERVHPQTRHRVESRAADVLALTEGDRPSRQTVQEALEYLRGKIRRLLPERRLLSH